MASPFAKAPGGVRANLRVTPRAARAGIGGIAVDAAGRAYLKVRVHAAPESGKANAEVIKLLAKAWGVPPSSLSVIAGTKGRSKAVHVAGEFGLLLSKLRDWIGSRHE